MSDPILVATGLEKRFLGGDGAEIVVLEGLDLAVQPGEFLAVTGESGAGKSTLLHLLGALDRPSAGAVSLDGQPYAALDGTGLARLRNTRIGFVFQFHHLLRDFTALENVMLPLLVAGTATAEAEERAAVLLERVGLGGRLTHRPSQLSGGEQQRAAVARALVVGPRLLLADEPTGNLDHRHSEQLHDLFLDLARESGAAVVVVTHNRALADRADRALTLEDRRLVPEVVPGVAG